MSTTYPPERDVPWPRQPQWRPDDDDRSGNIGSRIVSPLEEMQVQCGWNRVVHRRRTGERDEYAYLKVKKPEEDEITTGSIYQWLPDDDTDGDGNFDSRIVSPLDEMQADLGWSLVEHRRRGGERDRDAFACLKEKKPWRPADDNDNDGDGNSDCDSTIISPLEEMQAALGWSRVVHRRRGKGEKKRDSFVSAGGETKREAFSSGVASEKEMDAFASMGENKSEEEEKSTGIKYSSPFGRKMKRYDDDADEERFRGSKYYMQRYMLFRRYDYGIKMDREMWYSVTPELIARHIARRFSQALPASPVIIDAFCGAAGNTIQFSLGAGTGGSVIGIELCESRYHIAQHNTRVYRANDSCTFILGNAYDILPEIASKTRVDAIFLSPPWGGPEYMSVKYFDLSIFQEIIDIAKKITPNVAILVPRNIDICNAIDLFGRCEIELNYLYNVNEKHRKKPKTVTIYFGDLVKNVTTLENGPSRIELFDYDSETEIYTPAVGAKGFVDETRKVAKEHNYRNHFPELPTRKNDTPNGDSDLCDVKKQQMQIGNRATTIDNDNDNSIIEVGKDDTKFVRTDSPTSVLPIPNGDPPLATLASHRPTTLPPTISAPVHPPAESPPSTPPPVHVIPAHVKPPFANSSFVSSAFSPSTYTPPSTPPRAHSTAAPTIPTKPCSPPPGFSFAAPKIPKILSPSGFYSAPHTLGASASTNANTCAASIGGSSVTTISSELNTAAPSFLPSTPPSGRSTVASSTPPVPNLAALPFGFPTAPSFYALSGASSCAVDVIDTNTQSLIERESSVASKTCMLDSSAIDFVPPENEPEPDSTLSITAPAFAPNPGNPRQPGPCTTPHLAPPNLAHDASEHFFPYGQSPDQKHLIGAPAPNVFAPPHPYMPPVLVTPNAYLPAGNMLVMPLVPVPVRSLQTEINVLQRIIGQQERALSIEQYALRSRTPIAFFNGNGNGDGNSNK